MAFCCFSSEVGLFACGPSIPSGNIAWMFYPLLCALIQDKIGNLGRNLRFLLQMNHEKAKIYLEKCFLKDLRIKTTE